MVGQTVMSSVNITNTGQLDLTLTTAISGAPFAIAGQPDPTVSGGASTFVTVNYAPTAAGTYLGTLTINSNDPDSPVLVVDLSGSGVTTPVVADAGPDQSVDENMMVTLDGNASIGAANYDWMQLAGPMVTLSDPTAVSPTFFTPYVPANTTLTFQLVVDDGAGNTSDPDTVDVTVVDVNSPPVADAGDDATIKEGAVARWTGAAVLIPKAIRLCASPGPRRRGRLSPYNRAIWS